MRLICNDYGFECDYQVEGEDKETLKKFGNHCTEKHGICYFDGALIEILRRKHHPESSNLDMLLNKDEIHAVIAILDFVSSVHPMSFFENGLNINHRMIQQLIQKMALGIE